jgi:hypothetical protein
VGPRIVILAVCSALAGAGCFNNTTQSCQALTCPDTGNVYEVCQEIGGTRTTYNYGGQSCVCDADDVDPCFGCANKVTLYCADADAGADAGVSDGPG